MRNSLRRDVERLMMLDQKYRDDDNAVALEILAQHGCVLNTQQRLAFRLAPNIDVVIRRRRELSVKYPPSPLVAERRYKHYKEFIEEYSPQTWLSKILKRRNIT